MNPSSRPDNDDFFSSLLDRVSLAVVARAEIGKFRRWGRGRGWRNLRLLSSLDNTFNADFAVESDGGKSQFPAIIVFVRGEDGGIRHHYTGGAIMGPDQFRGLDLYSPVWHLFDLLPSGSEDWFPKHAYGSNAPSLRPSPARGRGSLPTPRLISGKRERAAGGEGVSPVGADGV